MQLPNFHKLSMISLLAAVMSIAYSTIAIGLAGHEGKQSDVAYNLDGFTKPNGIFGILNSLGTIAFAYGGGCCVHVPGPDRQCRAVRWPPLQSGPGGGGGGGGGLGGLASIHSAPWWLSVRHCTHASHATGDMLCTAFITIYTQDPGAAARPWPLLLVVCSSPCLPAEGASRPPSSPPGCLQATMWCWRSRPPCPPSHPLGNPTPPRNP